MDLWFRWHNLALTTDAKLEFSLRIAMASKVLLTNLVQKDLKKMGKILYKTPIEQQRFDLFSKAFQVLFKAAS